MKTFRQAVQGGTFTITADLTLQSLSDADDVARQVDLLGPWVDGIQVTDNPWNAVQVSAVAAASLVLRQGVDPIAVLTCRDRNRIALYNDLLGLQALGVTSVLLLRGSEIPKDHPVKAKMVFDTSVAELVAIAVGLGDLDPPVPDKEFYIGVGAKALRAQDGWGARLLKEKSSAGARFLQTQLCFNLDILRQYMQCLITKRLTWNYSVIVSLAPLLSADTARWLKKNLSGSRISNAVISRLEEAVDPKREGIEICAELMREIAQIPGVAGINLMTMGSPEGIKEAIMASGLR
jgi:methylenetetrahydrofolate reductase (NADPH)